MRMKKVLAFLLAGAMALSVAACGQTNEESKKNESGASAQESKEEEAKSEESKNEEPKEVPTLTWLVPGDSQQDIASVMEKVNEIAVEEIGAKIDIQFIEGSSFAERMKMNMAAGLDYDLCFTGYCNSYANAIRNEALLDITDYIENDPELKAALPDYAWEAAEYQGRIYGAPNVQGFARENALVIDKEMADKYGLNVDEITCTEDMESFLAAVKEGNEDDYFIWRTDFGVTMFTSDNWVETTGYSMVARETDGKYTVMPRQEVLEWQEAVQTIHEWYKAGYIRNDVLSAGDDSAEWNAGKYIVGSISYKPGDEARFQTSWGKEVVIAHIQEPLMTTSEALATLISVGADTKYPDEAVAFIKLVNTNTEVYNLICYGIEGKHYNLNEEGKVVKVADSGYNPGANWEFGNTFNALLLEGESEETAEITKEMNLSAKESPTLGFSFNRTAVETEYANVNAVVQEYNYLNTGAVDPEEYMEEFNQKLKDAGQDKIIAEYQRQLDEFLGQ